MRRRIQSFGKPPTTHTQSHGSVTHAAGAQVGSEPPHPSTSHEQSAMSARGGGAVASASPGNMSATVPFGISLRRNSRENLSSVPPPAVVAKPPEEAPSAQVREKPPIAATVPHSSSRSPERRKRDSFTLEDLIDPLMSDESRRFILESNTIDLGGVPRVSEDDAGAHGTPESPPRKTQSAKPIPKQEAGVSKIQQRQNRLKVSREASLDTTAPPSAVQNNVSVLATPKPIVDSGAADNGGISVGTSAAIPKSRETAKTSTKKEYTEAQITELLQGYFKISDDHRHLLAEGMQIRYFRVGSDVKSTRFVQGGYIRNVTKEKVYIESIPGGRRGGSGYFCYAVNLDSIAEIWKRYDPRVVIEIAIIQQMLKDQRALIESLQQQVSVLEGRVGKPK